ncbi:hypothetical protein MyxoNM_19300 [Myxococcus xanthus]|nr:hypothetical protein MyxoNM_19300 [Myxococcus xanthus]
MPPVSGRLPPRLTGRAVLSPPETERPSLGRDQLADNALRSFGTTH